MTEHFIGLMSGTSLDGVDGVLVRCDGPGFDVIAHHYIAFPTDFISELLALNHSGPDELHRSALASNRLVRVYAEVVQALCVATGIACSAVRALGAHGQTVRHRPHDFDGTGYTLQLNNPSLLAELSGIDVVADFRNRDVAAGGQGAPLVPAFHAVLFGKPDATVCVLNVGGVSNLTVLSPFNATAAECVAADLTRCDVMGLDCGPGNTLMDTWCLGHTGQPFDKDGAWAATGIVNEALLNSFLADPYLTRPAPKSTGRDHFNDVWLQSKLVGHAHVPVVDIQTTLTEFTARACASDVLRYGKAAARVIVCGGGALNLHLMRRLGALLPHLAVESSQLHGLPPLQVEAAAFAWLARKAIHRETGSLVAVTGARGPRILGGIYPA